MGSLPTLGSCTHTVHFTSTVVPTHCTCSVPALCANNLHSSTTTRQDLAAQHASLHSDQGHTYLSKI
eukprot:scaffold6024_cov126-Skeletonema_dohrnii-CCMP3373.AAC.1